MKWGWINKTQRLKAISEDQNRTQNMIMITQIEAI